MLEITTKDLVLGIAGRTKDIPTAIRVIQKNALNFNNLVHNTGLAIIVSSMPHDQGGHLDAGRALDFVKAVPGAIRKDVVAWLHKYSNIRISAKKDATGVIVYSMKLLKPKSEAYRTANPMEADANPFWKTEEKAERPMQQFTSTSLHKGLAALLNRYDAARKEDKVALTPKDIELIEALRRMDAEVLVRAQQVKTAGLLAAA